MTQTLQLQPRTHSASQPGPADILARRFGSSATSVLHQAKLASLSADFAHTLSLSRSRTSAGNVDGRIDPLAEKPTEKRADASKADSVEPADDIDEDQDVSAPDNSDELDESSDDSEIACADEQCLPVQQETDAEQAAPPTPADTALHKSAQDQPTADLPVEPLSASQILKERPVTIDVLNTLLLQGNASPRLALVAPQLRPGAALSRPASESAQAGLSTSHRSDSSERPNSTVLAVGSQPTPRSTNASDVQAAPLTTAHPQSPTAAGSNPNDARPPVSPQSADARPATSVTPIVEPKAPSAAPVPAAQQIAGLIQSRESTPRTDSSRSIAAVNTSQKLLGRLSPDPAARTVESPYAAKSPEFQRALDAQLQRGVAQALQSSSGSVTLRLQPAHLGQLKVQVKFDGQTIRAKFETATTKTRELLRGSIENLRSSLSDKGLSLDDVAFTIAPRLPERDLGLPPLHSPDASLGMNIANGQTSAGDADSGGAHQSFTHQGDSQPAEPGAAEMQVPDEHPVWLIGGSPLTIGHDGRIRVDATV